MLAKQGHAMSILSWGFHALHLLEDTCVDIYSQAAPRNVVLAAHERWERTAYDVDLSAVRLNNF